MNAERRATEILAKTLGRPVDFIQALGELDFSFTKKEAIDAVVAALEHPGAAMGGEGDGARDGREVIKDRAFACLVDAAEDMLAEIDTCGHAVDPAYRTALHEAVTIAKSVGHVPHWAIPAIENALDLLDEHGYTHSDLMYVRDWMNNKPCPWNDEEGEAPNAWGSK